MKLERKQLITEKKLDQKNLLIGLNQRQVNQNFKKYGSNSLIAKKQQ